MESFVDSILVAIDYKKDDDSAVLIVGRKRLNESVDIINTFEGDEALDLYTKLTKKRER